MKLITFVHENRDRLGALVAGADGEHVFDLNRLDPRLPGDMLAFLEAGRPAHNLAQQALAAASPEQALKLADVTLKAPIPRPGKIICIGQNYLEHAKESNASAPPFPIIFAKYANTVIAHGEPIVIPAAVQKPDYEGELAVVIGKPRPEHPRGRSPRLRSRLHAIERRERARLAEPHQPVGARQNARHLLPDGAGAGYGGRNPRRAKPEPAYRDRR